MPGIRFLDQLVDEIGDAVAATINAGGYGSLNLYTGHRPASANTVISSQTLLASFSTEGIWNHYGSLLLNLASVTATASGTVVFARLITAAGNTIADMDVSVSPNPVSQGATIDISNSSNLTFNVDY